jgi:hypothetical protein
MPFGQGNLPESFQNFPIEHKCNMYCQYFELGPVAPYDPELLNNQEAEEIATQT